MFNIHYKTLVNQYASEFLKEHYDKHREIIERACSCLMTERDVREFIHLMSDLYQVGYLRAATQYVEELRKLGIQAVIDLEKKA